MTVKNGGPKLFNVNATLGVTGDTSAISYSSGPSPASVDIPANNTQIFTWIYTANHDGIVNFSGTATGKRNNGVVHNTTATLNNVSITYVAANTAPVAQDGTLTVQKGASSSGTLVATDADNDTLTYSIVAGPSNGSVNITNTTTGAYTYTHNGTATSSDSFTFKANDGTSDSNIATITVTVNNTAPVAVDDSYITEMGKDLTILAPGILANDYDVEGDVLTVILLTNVSKGTLTLNPDGSFTYKPELGFSGIDTFTYIANDGAADSNIATVTIEVKVKKSNPLPEPILFPGVSLQQLTMGSSGASVIHGGKAITALEVAPGTQDILIEVKNNGFLTQIDVGVSLEGLPHGVSYTVGPQLQKVKAHNTATFTVTLTISPEVPEGTYQIKTTAHSRKGSKDRIDLTLVIK
jgi:hypothetical protein